MGPHRRQWMALALVCSFGCAAEQTKKENTTPIPAPAQCPKLDVQRITEISDIDRENQQQITKVNELEQRLANLQTKLSGALQNPNAAEGAKEQVSVASSGNKVRVRLSDELLFRPGSARISEAGRKALDQVASVLKDSASKRVEVNGHSDNQPMGIKKYEDNWDLSMQRARRVGSYLIEKGVDPKRMVMSGYADSDPLDNADTDEARAKNRRVEIFIEPTQ